MNNTVNLLADRDVFLLDQALPENIELSVFDPQDGLPENAASYDALIVRSVTRINASSIGTNPSGLKFIASATAGTDHVDFDFLKSGGISFYNSAGCNARSVAEYVITVLLLWAEKDQRDLSDVRVGIIGAGNTGSAVSVLLDHMGISWKAFDPPKELRDADFRSCRREELLACDVLTFHVPLVHTGNYATHHWLDSQVLKKYRFELIINACRGGVIDETALFHSYNSGNVGRYVLDVWENEPLFRDDIAENALFGTPHIAGYSIQSKWKATIMAVEAMARFFDTGDVKKKIPSGIQRNGGAGEAGGSRPFQEVNLPSNSSLAQLMPLLHPIVEYHQRLEILIGQEPFRKSSGFENIRSGFPLRWEFDAISLPEKILKEYPQLEKLGFQRL